MLCIIICMERCNRQSNRRLLFSRSYHLVPACFHVRNMATHSGLPTRMEPAHPETVVLANCTRAFSYIGIGTVLLVSHANPPRRCNRNDFYFSFGCRRTLSGDLRRENRIPSMECSSHLICGRNFNSSTRLRRR